MNPVIALRVAAGLAAVQGTAHTTLFVMAKPTHGAAEVSVVEAMKANRFDFGGAVRSYWDFYFGYGLEAAFVCFVEVILFWQLGQIARSNPLLVRPIIALFIAANLGHVALTARYFFYAPMVFDALIAAALAVAFVTANR